MATITDTTTKLQVLNQTINNIRTLEQKAEIAAKIKLVVYFALSKVRVLAFTFAQTCQTVNHLLKNIVHIGHSVVSTVLVGMVFQKKLKTENTIFTQVNELATDLTNDLKTLNRLCQVFIDFTHRNIEDEQCAKASNVLFNIRTGSLEAKKENELYKTKRDQLIEECLDYVKENDDDERTLIKRLAIKVAILISMSLKVVDAAADVFSGVIALIDETISAFPTYKEFQTKLVTNHWEKTKNEFEIAYVYARSLYDLNFAEKYSVVKKRYS